MIRLPRRFLLSGILTGFIAATLFSAAPSHAASGPVPDLENGGYVIYFRHGATTWSGVDQLDWPRHRQRLLSDEGIRQSEQVGEAFAKRGIPLGEILASPFARCADMARIAFDRVEERMELLGLLSDVNGRAERVAYLQDKVLTPPAPGKNRVIISHRSNITAVADVSLAEGEAVVLRPDGQGNFEVITTLMPDEWLD